MPATNEAPRTDGSQIPRRRQNIFACLFLAVLVWGIFGQTLHFNFINYDDPAYVYENPVVTQGLSLSGIGWIFSHVNVGTWFPLTDLTHQLDWQLYGANAGGHHLTNVLLHAATAICLFLALAKLSGKFWPASGAAAVFACHPLRVESVAWVVERKDVLSGLFFALTLWAWSGHVQQLEKRPESTRVGLDPRNWTSGYVLALAFFALGLLSKSMLVTLPFILLLLDYWPLNRLTSATPEGDICRHKLWLRLIIEKTPFLLLSVATGIVTIMTQKNAVTIAQNSTLFSRAGNVVMAYTDYLGHIFYPVGLTVAYAHPPTDPSFWPLGLAALLLTAISMLVVIARREHPYLLVGWLWYLAMLLPVIDIMQAGQNARADRYTYLPQIGLCIATVWGVAELSSTWRQRRIVLSLLLAVTLTSLAMGSYIQTGYWKNSVSLWNHALTQNSDRAFVHNTLGSALFNGGNAQAAIPHFQQAIQLEADYPEAHINLGTALAGQGHRTEAIQHFQRATEINPHSSAAQYNLGNVLNDLGRTDEAIQRFEQALALNPDYAAAHYALGFALASQEKWDGAIPHYERALRCPLDLIAAQYITAIAFSAHQKWAEAAGLQQRVLQARPEDAAAHNYLGIALAGQGKSAEAKAQFQQALSLAQSQGNAALAASISAKLNSPPENNTTP